MKIDKVKTAFKIMDAIKYKEGKIKFKYLKNIFNENGEKINRRVLITNYARVYLIVVNKTIYKIGQSNAKGGIKSTLSIYSDGGIKGRPSIRSYGTFIFLRNELLKNSKIEFYMIYQNPIKTKVKGLFREYENISANISSKLIEEKCLLDYKNICGTIPPWNLQEKGRDWPSFIKENHSKILQSSLKRKGRNK